MAHYSIQLRYQIFVKGYGFLSFARNMGKNINKNLSSKYSQKLLDHAKQSATDVLKTASKRVIHKTAGTTGDLMGNEIGDKITRISKISSQNNSEANEEEILKKRYISSEQRQKVNDDLRLIW